MATTDHAAALHAVECRALLNELIGLTPEMSVQERENYLVETGVIDVSRLLEIVHSKERGIPLDSRWGRDHADGANSKFTAAYGPVNGQCTAFGWRIKVSNCEADVLARFSNPYTGEVFKATIPAKAVRYQNYVTLTDCVNGGVMAGKWGKYITKVK